MKLIRTIGIYLLLPLAFGCTQVQQESEQSAVVEIVAEGLTFQAPDTIPSGWTTMRFDNRSEFVHFALVERLPEGINLDSQQTQVAPIFQEAMDLLRDNEVEAAMDAFAGLPEWFSEVTFHGGAGFVDAGRTADATSYLAPGTYLIECYVKTEGIFHSYNPVPGEYGMVHQLTVSEDSSQLEPPEATLHVSLSKEDGIQTEALVSAGVHTVAVKFEDQSPHEHFVGHDLHLARLGDGDEGMEALAAWMDWRHPLGLETPAPVEFIGGINELSAGETGYFTVALEPGRYAWVSEVPNPREKGMLVGLVVRAR